jgi:cytochrome c oxidase cbb3-type subunit III
VTGQGGYQVADNPAPRWWIALLCVAFALAAGSWYWHELLGASPTPLDRYAAERAAALDTGEPVTRELLLELAADELTVRAGAQGYARNCARCHGERGEGSIGPNLTDEFWLHGGAATDIYELVLDGRPLKGMPAWGLQLGPGACKQITAFVLTLRNTNVEGKPPEGERWAPPAEPPEN